MSMNNGDNDIYANGQSENSSKIISANSIESLDNCSTVSSGDPSNQVRTLFVSGLPMDTKPRELYLLFRAYSGYESSLLKVTNKNGKPSAPVGFVTFSTHQDANEARRKLQGVRFDPELSQTIRLELAKSNTKVSKPKQPSPPAFTPGLPGTVVTPNSAAGFLLNSHQAAHDQANFLAAAAANNNVLDQIQALNDQQQLIASGMLSLPFQGLPLLHGGNHHQFLPQNNAALAAMAHLQQQHNQQILAANGMLNLMGNPAAANNAAAAAVAAAASAANQQQHSHGSQNPPCSTLFVANLGSNPNEEEVRQLFKKFSGFCRLRLNTKSGSPVAFIEFSDVRQASFALAHLQGTQLGSSERGSGIRIEYAKTKMGEGVPSVPIL